MYRTNSLAKYLAPFVLAVSLLGLYLYTLAPGLTWANDGSDGGDLITAAATGGIPHPTGYPLYLLVARLFQLLPLGSLAFCTNLLSAVATSLAAVLVYELVVRKLPQSEGIPAWPGGLAAGYAFGLAPLVWSQAVITEVYALHGLLILLIFYLYSSAAPVETVRQKRLDRWRGLLLGLAMGNHLTTIFLVFPALFLGSSNWKRKNDVLSDEGQPPSRILKLNLVPLRRQALWFVIGLCVYLTLPARALAHPPVDWGNPVTLDRFWWLISGGVYQWYYLPQSLAGLWGQIQAWATLLIDQFGLPGLALGFTGLILFWKTSRLYVLTSWTALVFSAFAILYRAADSYVYLIPVVISFAIWIGEGISGLAQALFRRFLRSGLFLGLLVAAYFCGRAAVNIKDVDASKDLRADNFGYEVLSSTPKDALVFAKGDRAVFALWYFHLALQERPDLIVVASDLLHFDWYMETLQGIYPALVLPGSLPYPETIMRANPSRATCYVQYNNRPEIECFEPIRPP